jgi:uncharacterized membrane protein YfcA
MDFTLLNAAFVFLATLFGETFGCMFGGGGFFIQPALLAAGVPAKAAVANDIAAAAFSSVGFILTTKMRTREIKKPALYASPTLILGAIIGGHVLNIVPERVVELLILVICAAGFIYTLSHLKKKNWFSTAKRGTPMRHWKIAIILAGLVLGFYDGVSGAGGGIVVMATVSIIMRGDIKTTISMANWVGFITLSAAGLTFLYLGMLDFKLLALMIPAALLAGGLAAKISHMLPEPVLRGIYAGVLGCLLVYMIGNNV